MAERGKEVVDHGCWDASRFVEMREQATGETPIFQNGSSHFVKQRKMLAVISIWKRLPVGRKLPPWGEDGLELQGFEKIKENLLICVYCSPSTPVD